MNFPTYVVFVGVFILQLTMFLYIAVQIDKLRKGE
jgi:hypothetical protein